MKKWFLRLFIVFVVLAVGCSEEHPRDVSWAAANMSSQADDEGDEGIVEDPVFLLTMPAETGAWNPVTNPSQTMQGLMTLIFEPLVRLDGSLKPAPCLAEGWKVETGEEGSVYTFYLRGSVYFPDGSALTARDVTRSLDEILIAGEGSPWYGCLKDLVSWIAQDDKTVVITASRTGYDLIYQMNFPVARIVGEIEPLGTGPYRVEEYIQDQILRLTTQKHWWKQAPVISSIEAVSYPDSETELAARAMGDVDFVRTRDMTASLYRLAGVTEAQDYLTQTYDLLAFNFNRPIMTDLSLRQAIDAAIDRKEIISSVYQNHAVACEVPVPPDHWLHESSIHERISDALSIKESLTAVGFTDYDKDGLFDDPPPHLRTYETGETSDSDVESGDNQEEIVDDTPIDADVSEANSVNGGSSLITSAMEVTDGRASNFMSFTLLTNYHREAPLRRDAALRIADQLRKIGLDVKVREVELADLSDEIEEGDYDMLLIGYQMPLSGDLRFLLSSEAEDEQVGYKMTHYQSESIQMLLNIAYEADNETIYREAIAGIQKRLAEELPIIGLYFRNGTAIFNARLAFQGPLREGDPFRNIEQWRFAP